MKEGRKGRRAPWTSSSSREKGERRAVPVLFPTLLGSGRAGKLLCAVRAWPPDVGLRRLVFPSSAHPQPTHAHIHVTLNFACGARSVPSRRGIDGSKAPLLSPRGGELHQRLNSRQTHCSQLTTIYHVSLRLLLFIHLPIHHP